MHLQNHFPFIPIPHIRRVLLNSNRLYVPAFFQLRAESLADPPPFKRKLQASQIKKDKGIDPFDEAFEAEKTWLDRRLRASPLRYCTVECC